MSYEMMPKVVVLAIAASGFLFGAGGDSATGKAGAEPDVPRGYLLGPNDLIKIDIVELEDLSGRTYRVDSDGSVNVPLVGRIRIGGMTLTAAEDAVTTGLQKQVNDPHVSISLTEIHSQPVSILGEVAQPGVHQLEGRKTLYDMLAVAGGLKADAGYQVRITRREEWGKIPLPDARVDPVNHVSIAEVDSTKIQKADPGDNILICPQDIITVPRAQLVYVVGEVRKPGGIAIRQSETIPLLEALSAAEGLQSTAAPKNAKILRPGSDPNTRVEIPVDLTKVLSGHGEDLALRPDDVLFVPNSAPRKLITKAAEIALQTASGVIIFRH
jgi:polysaccharide export outer membrane protein